MARLYDTFVPGERDKFDIIPKSVLYEIAVQFGMRIADDFSRDGGLKAIFAEWEILHVQGIVNPRPNKKLIKNLSPNPSNSTSRASGFQRRSDEP